MSASRNVNIILNKLSVMIISNKAKGGCVMSIGLTADTGPTYASQLVSDSGKKSEDNSPHTLIGVNKNQLFAEIF